MKKNFQILAAAGLLAAGIAGAYFAGRILAAKESEVCIKNKCYTVEIASTERARERGLMYLKNLATDRGMLFEFAAPGLYQFWMKNTLIPLDMVWLDGDGRIVFIYYSAAPCVDNYCPDINPKTNANYVLEVNAGEMKRLGAKLGDRATIVK